MKLIYVFFLHVLIFFNENLTLQQIQNKLRAKYVAYKLKLNIHVCALTKYTMKQW